MGPHDPSEVSEQSYHDGYGRPLDQESVSELLQEASAHAKVLFRDELDVVRREVREAVKASAQASAIGAAGGFLAAVGFMALTACVILAIAGGLAAWLSALIVGGAWCIVGGICLAVARSRFQKLEVPRTRRHLQEDKQWIEKTVERVKSPPRANA